MPVFVSGAVEGPTDEPVLRRIIEHSGAIADRVQVQHGKPNLRRALPGFNQAARRTPWLVLVDLDRVECAPALVAEWLPHPSRRMRFRVAVRQVEAWLLADQERFAAFFSVPRSSVPTDPEALPDAKAALVGIVRRSRRAAIRADMVPGPGSGRQVGRAYTSRLIEFATSSDAGWRVDEAASRAPSLARCLIRLRELVEDVRR